MSQFTFATHNLVASFPDVAAAGPAIEELRRDVDMSIISVLTRENEPERPDPAGKDETAEVTDQVAKGAVEVHHYDQQGELVHAA